MAKTFTVADYLVQRLYEMGLRHIFSIPGDYVIKFLEAVENDKRIQRIGNTNEMEAGYAADGYARIHGIGAVAVTYGVGAFSLLNTIAGAYVEKVPIVVINGSPSTADRQQDRDLGLMWHHMMLDGESRDLPIYEKVTAAAVQIDDPFRATLNIDSVLSTCLTKRQPVYLEMFEDMYLVECDPPSSPLPNGSFPSDPNNLSNAVAAAAEKIKAAKKPFIWGGVEVQRLGVQDEFEALVKQTRIPFTTSLEGKSIVSEDNPLFVGVFDGKSSDSATIDLVTNADCLIVLGAWTTDINLLGIVGSESGGARPWGDDEVSVLRGAARVGTGYFAQVGLGDFIKALGKELKSYRAPALPKRPPVRPQLKLSSATPLSFDNFFDRMNLFVNDSMVVVADIGFSVLGAMNIPIKVRSGFVSQAVWASIGYAAPAAIGVQYAMPKKRPVVFAGDGAFHMVCQTIATMVALKQNPIIFVMNNGLYAVEQWLVDASVFEPPGHPKDIVPTNVLARWEFSKLTEVFGGGDGYKVSTIGELDDALRKIQKRPKELALVDVRLPELSFPANAKWKIDAESAPASNLNVAHAKRKARKNHD